MSLPPRPTARAKTNEQHKINYDGKVGQLYKLTILDILLRIVTLGIYSFWGRTRMRKYLVSRHELGDDRFEYTGTGGELFKGFLMAMPFLVVFVVILEFSATYPPLAFMYIPFFYLFGFAVYGALRYRYNRTRWRGISGFIEGSTVKFANLVFVRTILNVISLGFLIPSTDIKIHSYIMNNAYFGTVKAEYHGNSKILFGAHIKSILLALAIMSVFSAFAGTVIYSNASKAQVETNLEYGENEEPPTLNPFTVIQEGFFDGLFDTAGKNSTTVMIGTIFLTLVFSLIIILPLILRLTRAIYHAALMREKMRGLQIGNLKFMSTVGAWDVIKHRMLNTIILIFTLGLGYPFIVQRNRKFFVRHLIIMGDLESFFADQAKQERSTTGEGLDAALDLDIGIM